LRVSSARPCTIAVAAIRRAHRCATTRIDQGDSELKARQKLIIEEARVTNGRYRADWIAAAKLGL
jgi:hypothetical protein